jgi:D-alanine-D-alanine ligase
VDPGEVPVVLLYNLDLAWTPQEQEASIRLAGQLEQAMAAVGHPTRPLPLTHADLPSALRGYDPHSYVVFNGCESLPGIAHSEPLVARRLEALRFTFTGASAAALSLSDDKRRVKQILNQAGIPTPAWRVYHRPPREGWDCFPAIVKPVHEHSSEGITREAVVTTQRELADRIAYVLDTYRQPALVEDFIDGREFHVSLWGNGHIEMLPPAEMDFSCFGDVHDRLCTYDAKFVPGSAHYEGIQTLLPAPLSAAELRRLEQVCAISYRGTACRDYARIDVRLRDGVFYVLDVNHNADLSIDTSMVLSAELAGYSYGDLGSRIVRLAARRHPVWGQHENLSNQFP